MKYGLFVTGKFKCALRARCRTAIVVIFTLYRFRTCTNYFLLDYIQMYLCLKVINRRANSSHWEYVS